MKKIKRKSIHATGPAVKRRVAYSLAAGAAACVAGNQARADIVYSGLQNIAIDQANALNLDLDGYLGGDLLLKNYVFVGGNYQGAKVNFSPGKLVGFSDGLAYVSALASHDLVDATTLGPSYFGSMAYGALNPSAEFNDADNAFVGLSFPAGAFGTLYGWVRVDVDNAAGTFLVKDWAYEFPVSEGSASGGAPPAGGILAGDTGNGFVPEPGTLGLLAAGAAGLFALRRRRQQVA